MIIRDGRRKKKETVISEAVMNAATTAGEININLISSLRIHQILSYVFHSLCSPSYAIRISASDEIKRKSYLMLI